MIFIAHESIPFADMCAICTFPCDIVLGIRRGHLRSSLLVFVLYQSRDRKNRRVSMSIFTFLLDASVMNGYALYQSLMYMYSLQGLDCVMMSLQEFKHRIFVACVALYIAIRQGKMIFPPLNNALDNSARYEMDVDTSTSVSGYEDIAQPVHLSPPPEMERIRCYLCQLHKVKQNARRCRTVCTNCDLGFHVNCHAAFHNRDLLQTVICSLFCSVSKIRKKKRSRSFKKRSARCAELLSTFCLPPPRLRGLLGDV